MMGRALAGGWVVRSLSIPPCLSWLGYLWPCPAVRDVRWGLPLRNRHTRLRLSSGSGPDGALRALSGTAQGWSGGTLRAAVPSDEVSFLTVQCQMKAFRGQ